MRPACIAIAASLLLAASAVQAGAVPADGRYLLRGPDGKTRDVIGGFHLIDAATDSAIHLRFAEDPAETRGEALVEVVLTKRDDGRPALERTASFNVDYRGPMKGGRPAPEVEALWSGVLEAVRENDPGGILIPKKQSDIAGDGGREGPSFVGLVDDATSWVGIVLVLLFLATLPFSVSRLFGEFRAAPDPPVRRAWLAMVAVAAGMVARILVPHFPVMYYMGYNLARDAWSFTDIPKYGPGALGLHHLVFLLTGPDHVVMSFVDTVIGGVMPILAAAFVLAIGASRRSSLAAAVFVALAPLFIKDSSTESILIPMMMWLLIGLVLLLRYRRTGGAVTLALAVLNLLLAMHSRPEAVGLVPLTAALAWMLGPKGREWRSSGWFWTIGGAALALIVLRTVNMLLAVKVELSHGANPAVADPEMLLSLVPGVLNRNIIFWPSMYSPILTLLAASALLGPGRRRAVTLWVVAFAWLAVTVVDLPFVSIPRIQVPGAMFVTMAAAIGFGELMALQSRRLPTGLARGIAALEVAVLVGTMAMTIPDLWARTNADDEEQILREVRAVLPDEPVYFVRRSYNSEPRESLPLGYPDYWLRPPFRDDTVLEATEFVEAPGFDRPAYFFFGMRCYMRPLGKATGIHPACLEMKERFRLEPVIERTVPVRSLPLDMPTAPGQDLDFPYYLESGSDGFELGLYRILGPAG